jgi:putative sigma-54 modulation protein
MRLELTGRQIDITAGVRRIVETKLAKMARMLQDSAVSAQVVVSRDKTGHRADVTLHARGEKFLHGVGRGDSLMFAMTQAVEKLGQQARRVKGKYEARKRRTGKGVPAEAEAPEPRGARSAAAAPAETGRRTRVRMPRILRAERQRIRPMSVSDAAAQIDGGDGAVVFRDTETSRIAVLYRAPGGDLTLIETEA